MIWSLFFASICVFEPPQNWECVPAKDLSNQVQVGFLGKGKTDFRPSINLALEEVDLSLKEYVKVVKEIHETEMNISWRDLGEFTFKAGKGRLGEITSQNPCGVVKMLQGIYIKDGVAYILTGAALKDDFSSVRSEIISSLRSLSLVEDLFSPIKDLQKKSELEKMFENYKSLESSKKQQSEWESLQKVLTKHYTELGTYWLYLTLNEGYRRIFQPDSKS